MTTQYKNQESNELGFDLDFFQKLNKSTQKIANKLIYHSQDFIKSDGEIDILGVVEEIVSICEYL